MNNSDYHTRPPIRSPRYDTPRGGKLLTDSDIERYILRGFYGEARRLALLAARKAAKDHKKLVRSKAQATPPSFKKTLVKAIDFIHEQLET